MPVIGLLLLGMTFATGIMAGHLCVDIITALQEAADEEHAQTLGDGSAVTQGPPWRDRLLAPWADDASSTERGSDAQDRRVPPGTER